MSENNGELGAFLAGFVIGGLVGAATALILAPQSGQATRSTLAEHSAEWRNAGGQRFGNVRERANTVLTETRSRAQEASSQIQERIVLSGGKGRASEGTGGTMPANQDYTDTSDKGDSPTTA